MAKMQGAEDEDAGSVLKYMTKPESDSNEADWLLGCSINYGIRNVQTESAYVLVAFRFLARPFVSFVSHIARYAPSSTDKSSSLRNQKSTQPNF